MKIDVRINSLMPDNGSVKAIASVNFGDCFAVKGVKVMEGKNGLFVSMPSQKGKDGNYHDICFPISLHRRMHITVKRNIYIRMSQQLTHRLSVEPALDAHRNAHSQSIKELYNRSILDD